MTDLARLLVRLVLGGLLAGHGAQKLFGWFGGSGPEGTRKMMESMNLRPAQGWATLAGLSEFGGGVLTAVGALSPLGPLGIIGSMTMAATTVHRGKPIWVTQGGAELPLTNLATAAALALVGPGRYSVDRALRIRLPAWIGLAGVAAIVLTVGRALRPPAPILLETSEPTPAQDEAPIPAPA